jgi:hypothetical protein
MHSDLTSLLDYIRVLASNSKCTFVEIRVFFQGWHPSPDSCIECQINVLEGLPVSAIEDCSAPLELIRYTYLKLNFV